MSRRVFRVFPVFLSVTALPPLLAQAPVPFIRGDSNSDGRVSISDAYFTARFVWLGGPPPECLVAMDQNDDGQGTYDDVTFTVHHVIPADPPLPGPFPPFPLPGIDPTPDGQACAAYGNGSPIEDPAAELQVLPVEAPGGARGHVFVTLVVSSSSNIAGYSATIHDEAGVIERIQEIAGEGTGDLTGTFDASGSSVTGIAYSVVRLFERGPSEGNELRVGFVAHPFAAPRFIPPGTSQAVLKLSACLKNGTPAGEYPLTVEAAELADAGSGRAILPAKVSGTIRVLETIADPGCLVEDPEKRRFVRGDLDGDGALTPADVHLAALSLFVGGAPPAQCRDAMDANDDGRWNWADAILAARFLFGGRRPPPPPFPHLGIDPTPPVVVCERVPGPTDPSATLQVVDVDAPGGGSRSIFLTLAITSPTSLVAYSVAIRDEAGVIEQVLDPVEGFTGDLTGRRQPGGFSFVEMDERSLIRVGFLSSVGDPPGPIPPGTDRPVFRLAACLKDGMPAGEYPLTVEAAELVDSESARVIQPAMISGTIRLLEGIDAPGCQGIQQPDPLNVLFRLSDGAGNAGEEVSIPFLIKADRPSQGFSFSIDHDETVLEAIRIQRLFDRPDGIPYEFEQFELNNRDDHPGSSGILEGFAAGAAILSFTDSQAVLPVFREVTVLEITYRIKPSAPEGGTELRFSDGARGEAGPVLNKLIAGGREVSPLTAASFVFIHGRVIVHGIISDISIFIRGDSNRDWRVDVSDPINTLGFLFTGQGRVPCADAADADDDGALNVTDPIATLQHLFLDGPPPPAPYPGRGLDTREDRLSCLGR